MLATALSVAPAAGNSAATPELRFGSVRWEQIGPKRILFKIEAAWTPVSSPAQESDTVYCEPKRDAPPYSCRNANEAPTVGATLALRTPTHRPTSNRWVFGDEHVTGYTNGTALRGMRVVEDHSALPLGRRYLLTYTEVEHEYAEHGVYHAGLSGCCRAWDKLMNHRGYGWNVTATVVVDSLWEPVTGLPPSKGGPYSPVVPYVAEILVTAGVASEFYIKAVDHVRSASPGLDRKSVV